MKRINFKQGRYILPLVFLPFILVAFHGLRSVADGDDQSVTEEQGLKASLAPPSRAVTENQLADKLEEYRRNYRQADGYTAITGLQAEGSQRAGFDELYSTDEKRLLDSLEEAFKAAKREPQPSATGFTPRSRSLSEDDKRLLEVIGGAANAPRQTATVQQLSPPDHLAMLRKQFELLDSFDKAGDPEYQAAQRRAQLQAERDRELERIRATTFTVQRAGQPSAVFNTVQADVRGGFIKAIIDEQVTGYAGSRIRIRLLEDIQVGGSTVRKGTYLYALINGFSAQRITLLVSSIQLGERLLPVNLDIYDVDGMKGLHVPASAFREFTRQLGSNSMQGMDMSSTSGDGQSQFLMSAMQKAFQSTSTAISKAIRQNRANLKYASFIYLIDTQEMNRSTRNR